MSIMCCRTLWWRRWREVNISRTRTSLNRTLIFISLKSIVCTWSCFSTLLQIDSADISDLGRHLYQIHDLSWCTRHRKTYKVYSRAAICQIPQSRVMVTSTSVGQTRRQICTNSNDELSPGTLQNNRLSFMICKKKSWDIPTIVGNHDSIRLSCPVYVVTSTTYRSQTQRSHTHSRDCNTTWSRLLFCIFAQIFLSEIIKYIIFWSWPPQSIWLDYIARRKWYHLRPSHYSRIYSACDRYWVRDTTCHSNFSSFSCKSIMDRANLSTPTRLVKIFTIE